MRFAARLAESTLIPALTRKLLLTVGAGICIAGAVLIVSGAGLPERADFTGWETVGGVYLAPEVGSMAPPISQPTLHGDTLTLASLRGAPVVVNFWATWCAPCIVEMPELQTVYEAHAADGLRILAVNIGESPDVIAPWVASLGLTFDILLDEDERLPVIYRVLAQPSTFIIAPDGKISHIFYGPITRRQLESALRPHLS